MCLPLDFDHTTARVHGKLSSFEYIREMKADLLQHFNQHVTELHKYCTFGGVSEVYANVMANRAVKVVDDVSGSGSVFQVIDSSKVAGYIMRLRGDADAGAMDANVKQKLLKIINNMTKVLMVSVWIDPGLALRFPELSILSFGGSHRNLYFDADDRVFIIRSRYNKNTRYDSRILFLDAKASAQLFWFIYIIRPFTVLFLGDSICQISTAAVLGAFSAPEPTEEDQGLEEEADDINFNAGMYAHAQEMRGRLSSASAFEVGNSVLKSMV